MRHRRHDTGGGDQARIRRSGAARSQTSPHLGRAGGRGQPPDRADQVRGPQTQGQGHDRRRLRARIAVPVERIGLPAPRRRPSRRAVGPPSGDASARRARPEGRRHHPPPSDQRPPRAHPSQTRRRGRQLPDQQGPLPRLPHRARERLADRDRAGRRRMPPLDQRPDGHHRRPLGARRRRSDPEATSPQSTTRLDLVRCMLTDQKGH